MKALETPIAFRTRKENDIVIIPHYGYDFFCDYYYYYN